MRCGYFSAGGWTQRRFNQRPFVRVNESRRIEGGDGREGGFNVFQKERGCPCNDSALRASD